MSSTAENGFCSPSQLPESVSFPVENKALTSQQCSGNILLRKPNETEAKICKAEFDYIQDRQSIPAWKEFLTQNNLGLDIEAFLLNAQQKGATAGESLPNFGFAMSGGGTRALYFGAAILDAFDGRNEKAKEAKVGGILQLANYAASVSGGSWLLGQWAISGFPQLTSSHWKLERNRLSTFLYLMKSYLDIRRAVKRKKKAGFPVSIVDTWGGLLTCRLFKKVNLNEGDCVARKDLLWSSIRQTTGYKTRTAPFIIAVATSRPDKKTAFTVDSPTYEFTPEEFGVWHPHLNVSIPIECLGSPPQSMALPSRCVKGLDTVGFVIGSSSDIFSAAGGPHRNKFSPLIKFLDALWGEDHWEGKLPNPFKNLAGGSQSQTFQDNQRDILLMSDSGFINENIPIFPFLQPSRKIDAIIAVDSSADGTDAADLDQLRYPNGTGLFSIYSKTLLPNYRGNKMPKIPNPYDGTFQRLGYNKRPTIFGCDSSPPTLLIIYMPNYHMVAKTNIATQRTMYSTQKVDDFYRNGFAIASQMTGALNETTNWPACLTCAIIDRQVSRNLQQRTRQCQECFETYCARED